MVNGSVAMAQLFDITDEIQYAYTYCYKLAYVCIYSNRSVLSYPWQPTCTYTRSSDLSKYIHIYHNVRFDLRSVSSTIGMYKIHAASIINDKGRKGITYYIPYHIYAGTFANLAIFISHIAKPEFVVNGSKGAEILASC